MFTPFRSGIQSIIITERKMLDQLPPELLLSIATDEGLLRCDQISLSKASRALRARLLHLVFSEIGIDSIDTAKLPTRVNILEGKEHLVK